MMVTGIYMIDPSKPLSNPVLAVVLRVALGSYIVYMARRFYVNPLGYLRNAAKWLPEYPWLLPTVRALGVFCLWGGCFIIGAAIAVQIFDLHGEGLALVLVIAALIAAWFLVPREPVSGATDKSGIKE
jgi:hypothetical protein